MNQHLQEILLSDFSHFTQIMTSAVNALEDLFYIIQVHDQTFTYLFANEAGQAFLKNKQEIFGKNFFDLLPRDRAEFLQHHYLKAVTYDKVITFEEDIVVQGKWTTYESVLTPIKNGEQQYVVAVVRDVTKRRKEMKELHRLKQLFEKNEQR